MRRDTTASKCFVQLVGNRNLAGDKELERSSLPASELVPFQNYVGLRGWTRTGRPYPAFHGMRKSSTCGFDFTDYGMLGVSRPGPVNRHDFEIAGWAATPPPSERFSKIILASAVEFPYSTSSHGGVAQLGERLTGSQEVRGSIPLVSTRALIEAPTLVGAFFHIGTQGQRRHHDPPGRQDRTLNGCRAHGIISHRGSRWVARFDGLYYIHCFTRALGATVSAGDS